MKESKSTVEEMKEILNNISRTKEENFFIRYFSQLSKDAAEIKSGDSNMIFKIPALVASSGETANKFNEHLELILDFMGILEHEPELWERIKSAENTGNYPTTGTRP
jgi:hypothetical protein